MAEKARTKDFRPWWWVINPWLYIKRRDEAYDHALDIIQEEGFSQLSRDLRYQQCVKNAEEAEATLHQIGKIAFHDERLRMWMVDPLSVEFLDNPIRDRVKAVFKKGGTNA